VTAAFAAPAPAAIRAAAATIEISFIADPILPKLGARLHAANRGAHRVNREASALACSLNPDRRQDAGAAFKRGHTTFN